jgi:tetratricopeptide (TPR) repeat protein
LILKPQLRGANLFLGIAAYRKNDYGVAMAALRRETKLDPKNAVAYMWIGVTQLATGDIDAATGSLDRAAELNPNDVDILYHRGRAHMMVSQESYERMYEVDPKSWRIHQALAQAYVKADRLGEAVKQCREAIEMKPEEPGLHEELADVYWDQNQLASAETEFENELKIDPESLSSMYKLGVVSLERSKPEAAARLLSEVVRRSPEAAEAHYQLGRAQVQLGNVDDAITQFSAAVANSARSKSYSHRDSYTDVLRQSYYQLAQLYRRAHRTEESRAALESFMRLKQQADTQRTQTFEDKLRRSAESQDSAQ